MNTNENTLAAPPAAALEEQHTFNEAGVCEAPDIVLVAELPEHFAAEIRLARAADGWRVGFAYAGPPIGVSERGVLPALATAAFAEREVALAVGCRQLLAALKVKPKAKRAAGAVVKWARARGLDLHFEEECLPENKPVEPLPAPPMLQELTVADIAIDGENPRQTFELGALIALAESIKVYGILQPLVVRELRPDELADRSKLVGGESARFVVVAGERRRRAVAHLAKEGISIPVPCVVYEQLTPRQSLILALTENIQREAMNPIEEAEGFARLIKLGNTKEEVAELVRKSRSVVANALRLLALPDGVLQHLRAGRLTTAHGMALLRFKLWPAVAARIGEYALERDMPAGDLEEGLPFGFDLEGEGLVAWIDRGEYFHDDSLNEDKVPTALATMPWLFVDRSDEHAAEPDLWAMDPAAWKELRAKLVAERLEREAKARRAAKQASPSAPAPAEDTGEEVERDNSAERAAEEQAAKDLEAQREQTRREIDAAWQTTVKGLRDLTEVRREHLALLVEWASNDHRIGMVAENVDDAAHAIDLELPRSLKTIGNGGGAADKLAKFSTVELVRFALALRARAMWRLARRDSLAVPEELRLFTPAPEVPAKKKAPKAKDLKKAA